MKKTILTLALVAASFFSPLQSLAAEGNWITDFEKAKTQAKKESKLILIDFTGSDWCPPCKALHRNVFSKKEFLEYAKKNLVLVEIDFPKRKPQSPETRRTNRELARSYKVEGYPTVVVTDPEGKTLYRESGYRGDTADSFLAKIKNLKKK